MDFTQNLATGVSISNSQLLIMLDQFCLGTIFHFGTFRFCYNNNTMKNLLSTYIMSIHQNYFSL